MTEIQVEGIEKTIKEMSRYSIEKEKEFDAIVKKYAKETTQKAKSNIAPQSKTGNLKSSIKAKSFKKLGPSATVFPRGKKGAHRHLIEYGTKNRSHKSGKSVGNVTARPFMKPAQESVENNYYTEIKRVVEKVDTI
ncbi:HK97-gp10 family putative phage morphogenesis protein [Clostridium formicaceticum]|uniref:HK97 gp10 family phage protein n=1 Tax=Clostridium formicaceticum TaxID=1497 RepID=A0AAC9RNA0_9CLOT|nr:HK97-gp10 family putative phage morphogenesis protein [Clostridium formicaceticum]AOY76916.1 hypothetical protein BJL90_14260 [Clostridium formicaceticum]ARE87395.1 hypothetical protein CLFO_17950 [Clostridium formicaceticum]